MHRRHYSLGICDLGIGAALFASCCFGTGDQIDGRHSEQLPESGREEARLATQRKMGATDHGKLSLIEPVDGALPVRELVEDGVELAVGEGSEKAGRRAAGA